MRHAASSTKTGRLKVQPQQAPRFPKVALAGASRQGSADICMATRGSRTTVSRCIPRPQPPSPRRCPPPTSTAMTTWGWATSGDSNPFSTGPIVRRPLSGRVSLPISIRTGTWIWAISPSSSAVSTFRIVRRPLRKAVRRDGRAGTRPGAPPHACTAPRPRRTIRGLSGLNGGLGRRALHAWADRPVIAQPQRESW